MSTKTTLTQEHETYPRDVSKEEAPSDQLLNVLRSPLECPSRITRGSKSFRHDYRAPERTHAAINRVWLTPNDRCAVAAVNVAFKPALLIDFKLNVIYQRSRHPSRCSAPFNQRQAARRGNDAVSTSNKGKGRGSKSCSPPARLRSPPRRIAMHGKQPRDECAISQEVVIE